MYMGTLTHATNLLYNPDGVIYISGPETNGEATYLGTSTHAGNNSEDRRPGGERMIKLAEHFATIAISNTVSSWTLNAARYSYPAYGSA